MSLKQSFCPSPWFHMRINNAGHYEYCRWASRSDKNQSPSIHNRTPQQYFQQDMSDIRNQLLNGEVPTGCTECHQMEEHKKVSGRQKQLLKIGVRLEQFEKTLASSPWVSTFASNNFMQMPQDWQIDLGNYCNSACIFCDPQSSSTLAAEWQKIKLITTAPLPNWSDTPQLVSSLIKLIEDSPHIQYLHFIGGETIITPAFRIILEALIKQGLNRTATIGFTTNLISWNDEVVELLKQFQGVNLGMSVESFTPINDYVRWPATQLKVSNTLEKWISVAKQHHWLMQFRTTPTALTVGELLSVYDCAWDQGIAVESCNFLASPAHLRPSVLPLQYRETIIDQMKSWIEQHPVTGGTVINTRDPNVVQLQITQDLQSYINYLQNETDESYMLPELVKFLKRIESNRNNSIVTYLPKYEELFRSAGY